MITARPPVAASSRPPSPGNSSPSPSPSPADKFTASGLLTGAGTCGLYGAAVGGGTGWLYATKDLGTATSWHMTGIILGAAAGTPVMARVLEKHMEKPAAYALGALAAAGLTWGTSALGLMGSPGLGAAAGLALGAFYGGVGSLVLNR